MMNPQILGMEYPWDEGTKMKMKHIRSPVEKEEKRIMRI